MTPVRIKGTFHHSLRLWETAPHAFDVIVPAARSNLLYFCLWKAHRSFTIWLQFYLFHKLLIIFLSPKNHIKGSYHTLHCITWTGISVTELNTAPGKGPGQSVHTELCAKQMPSTNLFNKSSEEKLLGDHEKMEGSSFNPQIQNK